LPVALFSLLVIVFDPFSYFGIIKVIDNNIKDSIVVQVNPILNNLIKFEKAPSPYILLGDSRMKNMNIEKIRVVSGES
jgi:hypothetical protein